MMSCIKIVTEAIQKENTRDQRKIKIAIPAITAYASILMCSYKHYKICSISSRKTIEYVQYRKIKIAIPAITTYASILMRSYKHYKICSVSSRKTIEYVQYPSKILWTFGY